MYGLGSVFGGYASAVLSEDSMMARTSVRPWIANCLNRCFPWMFTVKRRPHVRVYRPVLTELEARLMPGSVVVALAELLSGQGDPYGQIPEVAPTAALERTAPDSLVDQ